MTRLQSTGSSSVTLTSYVTVSPKLNAWPATGVTNSTTGASLPTTMSTSAEARRPPLSVTVSVAR